MTTTKPPPRASHYLAFLMAVFLAACQEAGSGYSGYVEGEFLRIGADEPGRVADLHVRQGETVEAGASLFTLDKTVFEAERAAAAARVQEAQAALANLMAEQQRPEEIEVRLARRRSAQADLSLARSELDRVKKLFRDGFVSQARLDAAQSAYDKARAALAQVEKEIETARLSARIQLIEQAQAGVEAAGAALQAAENRLARRDVTAPAEAYVQEVFFRAGEVVPAGQPVVSLLPDQARKVIFFVGEPERAQFKPGTALSITCDNCEKGLTATVDWISAREEFTPPVIFSPTERAKLVFRLEARPEKPLALAPGQPVSVEVRGRGASEP